MNKAEEIFRTYFSNADEMHAFKAKYRVVSFLDGDNWGVGSCELHVTNAEGQPMVFEDRPSKIYVMPAATWYATIAWEYPGGILHRDSGPAHVSVDVRSGVQETYFHQGQELSSCVTKGGTKRALRYYFRGVQIGS